MRHMGKPRGLDDPAQVDVYEQVEAEGLELHMVLELLADVADDAQRMRNRLYTLAGAAKANANGKSRKQVAYNLYVSAAGLLARIQREYAYWANEEQRRNAAIVRGAGEEWNADDDANG